MYPLLYQEGAFPMDCLCRCWLIALVFSVFVGPAPAEERPKGKPPLVMKVLDVAEDHLVLGYIVPSDQFPGEREIAKFKPAFKDLRCHDRDGKELEPAEWKQRIKTGASVRVSADARMVDPAHLRKAEKGDLVCVWKHIVKEMARVWFEPFEPTLVP
jgi:hypothetical protein